MERYTLLKQFLKKSNLNIAHFSNKELFCIYLQNIEGFDIPLSIAEAWFDVVSYLVSKECKNNIKKRLKSIRENEIGMDCFLDGTNLVDCIEFGDS